MMNGDGAYGPPPPPEPVQVPEVESKEKQAKDAIYKALVPEGIAVPTVESAIPDYRVEFEAEIENIPDVNERTIKTVQMDIVTSAAFYNSGNTERASEYLSHALDLIKQTWGISYRENPKTVDDYLAEADYNFAPSEEDKADPEAMADFLVFWGVVLKGLLKRA